MDKYVIDTSALITAKEFYPLKNFQSLWQYLVDLNKNDRLIIIDKVKDEIDKGNDFLKTWFSPRIKPSKSEIPQVVNLFSSIMMSIPKTNISGFMAWLRETDPFVIAYSEYLKQSGNQVLVLHGENVHGSKIRIPYVCNLITLGNGQIHRLIVEENLSFSIP